jgi:nicotinate-nucleotide adenylyltransferase
VSRCIAVLGGSFDPAHKGHVELATHFVELLQPNELRIVPAGDPWQKPPLHSTAADRLEMLKLAFAEQTVPVIIDTQEITRSGVSYSIDTLRAIRAEAGSHASIAFLLGADQLQQLHTWREWEQLFDLAHICAASRPGFLVDEDHAPTIAQQEFKRRTGTAAQIRSTPHGLAYLATNLAVDISATAIRAALARGEHPAALMPPGVLDYIQHHHLYKD